MPRPRRPNALSRLSTLFLCFALPVQALNITELLNFLNNANLTGLASAAEKANQTADGAQLINRILDGNYTIFAPNNAAFEAPSLAPVNADPKRLAAVLSYHVLPGNFTNGTDLNCAISPSHTVGRTLLSNPAYVHLEGNKSQVLVWTRKDSNSPITILNQPFEVQVLSTASAGGVFVATIDKVLVPPNSTSLSAFSDLSTLSGLLDQIDVTAANGSKDTVADFLGSARGLTIFAPINSALPSASNLSSLAQNQTEILTVLGNHYVNGSSLYFPTLLGSSDSSSFISAAGEQFTFTTNSSGTYVISGNNVASAKIVQTDSLLENGVVHFIDGLLLNTERDDSKAGSAYSSATSSAGQPTTETGPIGPTSTSRSGGGGGSGRNATIRMTPMDIVESILLTLAIGFLGWFLIFGS